MVTKSKATGAKKKGRVKVGKLKLKKETVKELSTRQEKQIKGDRYPETVGSCVSHCLCL